MFDSGITGNPGANILSLQMLAVELVSIPAFSSVRAVTSSELAIPATLFKVVPLPALTWGEMCGVPLLLLYGVPVLAPLNVQ